MSYEQELKRLKVIEEAASRRRLEQECQAERFREMKAKDVRWQLELQSRADGKPMDLWVRWYEV